MPHAPAGADFGAALTALLRAAGLTPDKVRAQLKGQRWPASRSTLYDWMNNEHLPDDDGPLMEVVDLCLAAAGRRGVPVAPAPADARGWRQLLAEARQARDTRVAIVSRSARGPSGSARTGMPIGRWHHLALGVHRAIGGDQLPGYVNRAHDDLLRAVLDPAEETSRTVVLRGSSSTGKTRAAYEAVSQCLPDWWVDYPRSSAILEQRLQDGFAARTVVWLDDLAQFNNPDIEVLIRLNDLLASSTRVIVIATMWPAQWSTSPQGEHGYRSKPSSSLGPRRLLQALPELSNSTGGVDPKYGGIIDVPDRFTKPDLVRALLQKDRAVVSAINTAKSAGSPGMIAQYLAGVPDLEEHYAGRGADPYGRALMTAAMDMARFGFAGPYSESLLHKAILGYLGDSLRTVPQGHWWQSALEYAAHELKGTVAALIPVPPPEGTGIAGYRLTDYLDQQGRRSRQASPGPTSLWVALVAQTTQSADLSRLGLSAYDRGFYRYAARFWKKAVLAGGTSAVKDLLGLISQIDSRTTGAGAGTAAQWIARNAPTDDPAAVASILNTLREAGHPRAANELVTRAVKGVCISDPDSLGLFIDQLLVMAKTRAIRATAERLANPDSDAFASPRLLEKLTEAGEIDVVVSLAIRFVEQVELSDPRSVTSALRVAQACGDHSARVQEVLLDRHPADRVALDDSAAVTALLQALHEAKAGPSVAALAARAAAKVSLEEPKTVSLLLKALKKAGQPEAIARLMARNPAELVMLDDTREIVGLFEELHENGRPDIASALGRRFAVKAPLDSPRKLDQLFSLLIKAGERESASMLASRAVERRALRPYASSLVYMWDAVFIFGEFDKAGEDQAVAALAAQVIEEEGPWHPYRHSGVDDLLAVARRMRYDYGTAAARKLTACLVDHEYVQGPLEDPLRIADRIKWLHRGTAVEALNVLLKRQPSINVSLIDAYGVARLLGALRRLGASAEVEALLARHPEEQVVLDDAQDAAALLNEICALCTKDAIVSLVRRISDEVKITDALGAAQLLDSLSRAAAQETAVKLARQSLGRINVSDPRGAASLVIALFRLDLPEEAGKVAALAAARVDLGNGYEIAELLKTLKRFSCAHPSDVLKRRAADAGHFNMLVKNRLIDGFKFGREPDGSSSPPWRWPDL